MRKIFLCFFLFLANALGEANLSVNLEKFERNSTNSAENSNSAQINSNLTPLNSAQNQANSKDSNSTQPNSAPNSNLAISNSNSTPLNSTIISNSKTPNLSQKIASHSNFDLVKAALAQEFRSQNPKIIIRNVELQTGTLPKNFAAYEFIKLGDARFVKASGYVRAVFKTPENTQKNVFFRYFVKAKVEVLRANRDLQRGEVLASTDYSVVFYDFDKVPLWALEKDDAADLIARTAVRKHSILKQNMFKANHLVKANSQLMAVLGDGEVKMSVEVAAIEAGNKGDTIKVKTKDGKVLQAVIIDKNQVSLK